MKGECGHSYSPKAHGVCLAEGAHSGLHPSFLSPFPPYGMGMSVLCLPHQYIPEPHNLPGFTGSQLERNFCLKMNRTSHLI